MENNINNQNEIIELFENDIDVYLHQFMKEQKIDDLKTQPQAVWNGCLRYIYRHVFKDKNKLLKQHANYDLDNNYISTNCNMYNYDLLLDIVDYYIYDMCMVYNKEVSILGFVTLTGIDESIIYDWGNNVNKLSSSSSKIYQKLTAMREESLSNKLADGKQNPVGVLAILNRHYQWNLPGVSKEPAKKSLKLDDLPQLGQVKDLIDD